MSLDVNCQVKIKFTQNSNAQFRFTMLSLGLVLVTVIGVSQGYPFGAPACVSAPRHGFDPQEDDINIEITKEETQNRKFVIQLGNNEEEETFRGFLVLTKSPGEEIRYSLKEMDKI